MMNFFQDLKHKLGKGFEQAGNKSQRVYQLSRLSLKLKSKREMMDELVEQLGWTVYEAWEENKEWKETEKIKESVQAVYEIDQEIKSLEEELDRLKNSNITERSKAETVELPITPIDDPPSSRVGVVETPSNRIYHCPTCAHQVMAPSFECRHCRTNQTNRKI